MADISLKIKSDTEQAEKDFRDLAKVSESTRQKIEKFSKSFKTEQIDKFRDKNKLAATAVTATRGKLAGMRTESKGLQKEIERLIKRGMSPQDKEIRKLTADYDRLQGEIAQTTSKTRKQSGAFSKGIKAVAGYAAAYVSFRAAAGMVRGLTQGLAEQGDQIGKTARQLGVGVEALQEFRFVAERQGVTVSNLEKSMKAMNNRLGLLRNGQGQLNTLLRDTNPELLKQLKATDSSEESFMLLMKAMNGAGSAAERTALAQAAFSSSGRELVRISEAGAEGIDKLRKEAQGYGMIMSQEVTEASEKFLDAQTNLFSVLKGLTITLGAPLLEPLTNAMNAFTEWASKGDNLRDMITGVGYAMAAVAGGIAAYVVATQGAAIASGVLAAATKALTAAMAANPFTFIAVFLTAVLVPAVIWMAQNWDLVKFKVLDFALAARIKLLEFGIAVREKVMGAVIALMEKLSELPVIGEKFKAIAKAEEQVTEKMRATIRETKAARAANEERFREAQEQHKKERENAEAEAKAITEKNEKIKNSDFSRSSSFVAALEKIKISDQAAHRQRIEEAQEFFEKRAEMEGETGEQRLEWLRNQQEKIAEIEGLSREQRLEAEKALRKEIAKEEKMLVKSRVKFGQEQLSATKSMMQDLQTVFENAGIKSRGLAIAMKAIASAEAAINSYLAFTVALASYPPPYSFIAAGITLAAGLAQQAAIWSTPIPSAQTGISDYTVPDTRTNRNDGAAVMASAGERVSVEPRGSESGRGRDINIMIEEEPIFRVIQRGIDTGKIDVNSRNVGAGVFAT